jgi:hypothetical protein
MNVQTTEPSMTGAKAGRLIGLCAWIMLDALASWVWSLAGARAAGLLHHESD